MPLDLTMIGLLLTLIVLLGGIGLLAMDERNRGKFVTKDEEAASVREAERVAQEAEKSLQRVHRRIDTEVERIQGLVALHASLDDRIGDTEKMLERMDERQTQHWERVSKDLHGTAETIKAVMEEVRSVSSQQVELVRRMERLK